MKSKKSIWIITVISAAVFLFIIFQQWGSKQSTSAEILSEKEAKAIVEERYNGQVTEIVFNNNQYVIEMDRSKQVYEIKLDAKHGEVISFMKQNNSTINHPDAEVQQLKALSENEIKQKLLAEIPGDLILFIHINENGRSLYKMIVAGEGQKTILKVDAKTGEILFRKIEKEIEVVITENEATQIAMKQVKGKVNDVDIEQEGSLSYYLVEIDTPDDREATVQIHAITGEVLSIAWDD